MRTNTGIILAVTLVTGLVAIDHWVVGQGDLTPPGAPAPMMKTLAQIEPRTPITNLPVTITQPGSYYVTANLTGNPGGITISASGVTLDLMGFELVGGTGDGIAVSGARTNIAIRNGTVRNWGSNGVNASTGHNAQYEALRVSHNAGAGLYAGSGSIVSRCTVTGNTGNGIVASDGTSVADCAARQNGGNGILAGTRCTITGCMATANGGDGVSADIAVRITGCAATSNTGDGIQVNSACHVVDNQCTGNGNSGDGAGIHATGLQNRLASNSVIANDRGIDVDDTDNLIIQNNACDNATEYDIVSGNGVGEIRSLIGGATITNASPWANFSF